MRYAHIVEYVARTPWAILPDKMTVLLDVLAFRASDQEFTAEEIRARLDAAAVGRTPPAQSRGNVAVVPLRGTIAHRMSGMEAASGGASAEAFASTIRQLAADDNVGAIVIDCDSPGGTVTGVAEAAQAVFDARQDKSVVAVANGMMASSAYWICSQASEIVAIPSIYEGVIGNIGVYAAHADLSAALQQQGVKMTLVSAGKYKLSGSPFQPLSDEEMAVIQKGVDAAYAQFTTDVARGRGVSPSAVRAGFGEGRGLSAIDAKAAGVVDRIATMDETLSRLLGTGKGSGRRLAAETIAPALAADAVADGALVAEHDALIVALADPR